VIKIKDAYYFSHDANARNDPKVLKMRSVYGMKGYGCYWIIVEMLREQNNYKFNLDDLETIAMQSKCKLDYIQKLIGDCIEKYKLFKKNRNYFWSNSLLKRMKIMEEKKEKARKAAKTRWDREYKGDADAMQTHSERNAIKGNKNERKNEISDPPVLNLKEM
jgi:hypothetical protein